MEECDDIEYTHPEESGLIDIENEASEELEAVLEGDEVVVKKVASTENKGNRSVLKRVIPKNRIEIRDNTITVKNSDHLLEKLFLENNTICPELDFKLAKMIDDALLKEIISPATLKEGIYSCVKCKKKEYVFSWPSQMASGDEQTAVKAFCIKCQFQFRVE